MSHSPPVPQGNQSPFPRQEPPHDHAEPTLPPVAKAEPRALADRARDVPLLAIGAAIGLGAAAIGGLMFALTRTEAPRPKRRRKRGG